MATQIIYGYQNLTNNKMTTNATDGGRNTAPNLINSTELSRTNGAIVTNVKPSSKVITLTGSMQVPSGSSLSLLDIATEYDEALDKEDRILRIVRSYTEVASMSAISGWSLGGDATNLTADSTNYQYGTASLNFDINTVSSSNLTIENSTLTQVDLSAVDETGSFGLWVFLPSKDYFTDLTLRVGNDSSNYWSGTLTTNHEGTVDSGWNYFVFEWSQMSETGTVTPSAIDYVYIDIDYSGSSPVETDYRVDGLVWNDEDETRNYRAYRQSFDKGDLAFQTQTTDISIELFIYEGIGFSTFTEQILNDTNITSVTTTNRIDFGGSYEPVPVMTVDVTTATNLADITIKNLENNQQVSVTPSSINDGDIFTFDFAGKDVAQNDESIDYDSVFPVIQPERVGIELILGSSAANTQQQTTGDASQWGTTSAYRLAQTFTAGATGNISNLQVYGRLNDSYGNSTAAFAVGIYNDSGGSLGSLIDTGILFASKGSNTWNTVGSINGSVTSASVYWIVINPYISDSFGVAKFGWRYNTAGGYASGEAKLSTNSGASYSALNGGGDDYMFKVTSTPAPAWDVDFSIDYKKRYI